MCIPVANYKKLRILRKGTRSEYLKLLFSAILSFVLKVRLVTFVFYICTSIYMLPLKLHHFMYLYVILKNTICLCESLMVLATDSEISWLNFIEDVRKYESIKKWKSHECFCINGIIIQVHNICLLFYCKCLYFVHCRNCDI